MIAPNHMLAGAVVALTVTQPVVAIVLAYISHYVLDALPHFGLSSKYSDIFERNKQLSFKIYVVLGVLGAVILAPLLIFWLQDSVAVWLIMVCVVAANLPDLVYVPRFIYEVKTHREPPKSRLLKFHGWIQKLDRPWGALVEVPAFIIMLYIIFQLR